jgi:hypothetical protein
MKNLNICMREINYFLPLCILAGQIQCKRRIDTIAIKQFSQIFVFVFAVGIKNQLF